MADKIIYVRREKNDIGISVTNKSSNYIIYKGGFKSNNQYYNDEAFKELQQEFLKHLGNSDIHLRNNARSIKLLTKLLDGRFLEYARILLDNESKKIIIEL